MCRITMKVEEFEPDSREIISLSTLISNKSKNMKFNYKVTEDNKKWYDLGKKLFYKKQVLWVYPVISAITKE